jgi:hypothetical protein
VRTAKNQDMENWTAFQKAAVRRAKNHSKEDKAKLRNLILQ